MGTLAKAVVPETSPFVAETITEAHLQEFHRTTVLAIRREGDIIQTGLHEVELEPGDLLLVQTDADAIQYLTETGDTVVIDEDAFERLVEEGIEEIAPLSSKTPIAIAITAGVVGVAALNIVSIVVPALGGVFLMVVTGRLSSADASDAVSWNIIFLLAGVIPLGLAMEAIGGAALISGGLVATADVLPIIGVLLLFYIVTGLLANVITPVATLVVMIPIAVDAAMRLKTNGFAFLIAVTFASATSFMTPVGYQSNLMVYGPGGCEFAGFLKVGGPHQFLLAIETTAGIAVIWGL